MLFAGICTIVLAGLAGLGAYMVDKDPIASRFIPLAQIRKWQFRHSVLALALLTVGLLEVFGKFP